MISRRKKPLQELAEANQTREFDSQSARVHEVAYWLTRDAIGQAEMGQTTIDNEPHFDNLATHDFTDQPSGKNIITYHSEKVELPGFTVEQLTYRPTPKDQQLPHSSIDAAVASAEVDDAAFYGAVRLTGEGIALTYDYGDKSSEPRVSARIIDPEHEYGYRQATPAELVAAFEVSPEDF